MRAKWRHPPPHQLDVQAGRARRGRGGLAGGMSGKAADGPLTAHLQAWARHLSPEKGPRGSSGRLERVARFCRGSKVALLTTLASLVVALSDAVAALAGQQQRNGCGSSPLRSLRAAVLAAAYYSALAAVALFARRGGERRLAGLVADLAALTASLEPRAAPASKARMRRTARRGALLVRFMLVSGVAQQVLLTRSIVPAVSASSQQQQQGSCWAANLARALLRLHRARLGPPESDAAAAAAGQQQSEGDDEAAAALAAWLDAAMLPVQLLSAVFCRTAFYTTMLLVWVLGSALADAFECVGCAVQVQPCSRRRWPSALSAALRLCLALDGALAARLPHVLLALFAGPLLSTVEIVTMGAAADAYALGLVTIILTMFLPLCLLGDRLKEARASVADRAYQGPWLEECIEGRRLRLGVMGAAGQGRDSLLRGRYVGPVDREFFRRALRSWFSFLQYLLNLQGLRQAAAR